MLFVRRLFRLVKPWPLSGLLSHSRRRCRDRRQSRTPILALGPLFTWNTRSGWPVSRGSHRPLALGPGSPALRGQSSRSGPLKTGSGSAGPGFHHFTPRHEGPLSVRPGALRSGRTHSLWSGARRSRWTVSLRPGCRPSLRLHSLGSRALRAHAFRSGTRRSRRTHSFRPGTRCSRRTHSFRPGTRCSRRTHSFRPGTRCSRRTHSFRPGTRCSRQPLRICTRRFFSRTGAPCLFHRLFLCVRFDPQGSFQFDDILRFNRTHMVFYLNTQCQQSGDNIFATKVQFLSQFVYSDFTHATTPINLRNPNFSG